MLECIAPGARSSSVREGCTCCMTPARTGTVPRGARWARAGLVLAASRGSTGRRRRDSVQRCAVYAIGRRRSTSDWKQTAYAGSECWLGLGGEARRTDGQRRRACAARSPCSAPTTPTICGSRVACSVEFPSPRDAGDGGWWRDHPIAAQDISSLRRHGGRVTTKASGIVLQRQ